MNRIVQLVLLLLPVCCFSQQRTIDSLERLLPTASTDSAGFLLSYNIGNKYIFTDYDSALYYTNKGLLLAQKNGKKLNEAAALNQKGFVLERLQRLTESYQLLTTALQIAEAPRNENSFWNISKPHVKDKDFRLNTLANIQFSLAIFLQDAGRTDQAVFRFKKAINFYILARDSLGIAVMTVNLGDLYWRNLNKPDSALLFIKTAESILIRNKEESRLGFVYATMGASYLAKHNDSIALACMYKAVALGKKYDAQDFLVFTYRELARLYIQKANKDSALYYAQQAANIHIPVLPMDLGDDFELLAKSYALNHQQDSAYKYQGIALSTYDSLYENRIKGLTGFQQLSFNQQQQLQQLKAEKIAAQNRTRIYTLLAGLGVIMLIGFFLYRNNQHQKRANLLLQQQKRETEEQKQKAESALGELKATQAQLIQSEKMASLGELTAGIAHEIQNPLNFVNNFSEVNKELITELKEEVEKEDWEEVKAIANDIEENEQKIMHHGRRAESIVKGMLEHSRASSGKKELTDINALVDECIRLSYHGLRAKNKEFNANINTGFDESIGKINIVPQDISRVLLNLFNNAFYAVNEKKAKLNGTYEPIVSVCTKNLNGKAEIVVTDNGNGIPPSIINKIFQPFFTTKPTGQGTGLGLSLSYDIIKAHTGEIQVESKEGEGSKFIIELPANN